MASKRLPLRGLGKSGDLTRDPFQECLAARDVEKRYTPARDRLLSSAVRCEEYRKARELIHHGCRIARQLSGFGQHDRRGQLGGLKMHRLEALAPAGRHPDITGGGERA
jgi:hypothetical protein